MWWGGFLLCGVILLVVAVPFFSFPKVLAREKKKIRKSSVVQPVLPNNSGATATTDEMGKVKKLEIVAVTSKEDQPPPKVDTGYGKDIKDIPQSMLRLVKNPVYIVTCLGACMELMIVSGFVVFLPKYLETQFSLGKSQANIFTGSIAVPGACIGIFLGGCILKRFQLKPKGAVQFVLITNVICLACYAMLFFLGCDNLKMAAGIAIVNKTSDNICKSALVRNQDMDLGRLSSGLSNQPLAPHTLREDNCLEGKASTTGPVLLFVLAQLLLGCGGSPLFTLGTTYVDDHVRTESSSMYIGCMYSMGAFGPVVGFLLGAYLLSFHMDSLSSTTISISE